MRAVGARSAVGEHVIVLGIVTVTVGINTVQHNGGEGERRLGGETCQLLATPQSADTDFFVPEHFEFRVDGV